jgi:hypothetical protein
LYVAQYVKSSLSSISNIYICCIFIEIGFSWHHSGLHPASRLAFLGIKVGYTLASGLAFSGIRVGYTPASRLAFLGIKMGYTLA